MEVTGFGRNSVAHLGLDKDGKPPSKLKSLCGFLVFVLICVALCMYVPYGGTIVGCFGALMLALTLFSICWVATMNDFQKKALPVVSGDQKHLCPGQFLEIKERNETTRDIIVPREWVKDGKIDPNKPVSLRRSLDMTIVEEFKSGSKYAEEIKKNFEDDPNHPLFHVHGWSEIGDLKTETEFWTAFPYYPHMGTVYAWCQRVSGGWFSPVVEVDPQQEDVLGHLYLLSVDKGFYEKGEGVYRISGRFQMNANVTDPNAAGKIIARFKYTGNKMGTYVDENADSFIFKGDVIRESGLKVLTTYRIVVPPTQSFAVSDSGANGVQMAPLLA